MCCFCLHFPDFNVLFFQKIKNLLQFTFEKNNLLCKKREKNNLLRAKIPAPPPPPDIKWSVPYTLIVSFNPTWSTLTLSTASSLTWSTCYFTTYPIWSTLSLPYNIVYRSWILGYGFMITCSVMPIWPLFEFI